VDTFDINFSNFHKNSYSLYFEAKLVYTRCTENKINIYFKFDKKKKEKQRNPVETNSRLVITDNYNNF